MASEDEGVWVTNHLIVVSHFYYRSQLVKGVVILNEFALLMHRSKYFLKVEPLLFQEVDPSVL